MSVWKCVFNVYFAQDRPYFIRPSDQIPTCHSLIFIAMKIVRVVCFSAVTVVIPYRQTDKYRVI